MERDMSWTFCTSGCLSFTVLELSRLLLFLSRAARGEAKMSPHILDKSAQSALDVLGKCIS